MKLHLFLVAQYDRNIHLLHFGIIFKSLRKIIKNKTQDLLPIVYNSLTILWVSCSEFGANQIKVFGYLHRRAKDFFDRLGIIKINLS